MSLTRNRLKKKKKHPIIGALFLLLFLLAAAGAIQTVANKRVMIEYASLPKEDQRLLEELNILYEKSQEEELWADLDIFPVILIPEDDSEKEESRLHFRHMTAYAIGVEEFRHKWYAKRIFMPEEFAMPAVFRMSVFAPALAETWDPIWEHTTVEVADSSAEEAESTRIIPVLHYKESMIDAENPQEDIISVLAREMYEFSIHSEEEEAEAESAAKQEASAEAIILSEKADAARKEQREVLQKAAELFGVNATEDEWHIAVENYLEASARLSHAEEQAVLLWTEETREGISSYIAKQAYAMVYDLKMQDMLALMEEEEDDFLTTSDQRGCLLCMILAQRGPENWQQRLNADPDLTLHELFRELNAEG